MTIFVFCLFGFPKFVSAVDVEINGDHIEYSVDGKKVIVTGNAEIKYLSTILTSDYAEYIQSTNIAYAKGNVVITDPDTQTKSDEITYDLGKGAIKMPPARFVAHPYYFNGEMEKREDGRMVFTNVTYTTSDYDDAEYRWKASKASFDPNTSILTAKDVRLKLGDIPVFYWPWFSKKITPQNSAGKHSLGYDSGWGMFVLNEWSHQPREDLQTVVHLDYREMRDLASGVDLYYGEDPDINGGLLRTYYMWERNRRTSHWFEDRNPRTIETEKYWALWRHAYRPDDTLIVMTQASLQREAGIRQEYFEDEAQRDPRPATYLTATKYLAQGALSARVTPRINDFESQSEYLPEIRYDIPDQRIGDSGFYWKSASSAAYLTRREGDLARERDNNARFDFDQEFSYPFQVGIVHFAPFTGTRHTSFRKTDVVTDDDAIRGMMNAGMTASTKFFRVYDVRGKWLGEEFDRLRHIMTPTITYEYVSDPTVDPLTIRSFDNIDALYTDESIRFIFENKLQTKRNKQSIDILRLLIASKYNMEEDSTTEDYGFQVVNFILEFRPANWMLVNLNAIYDTERGDIQSYSIDTTVSYGKWYVGAGHRYHVNGDGLLTTNLGYSPDRKWNFGLYHRFNIDQSSVEEEQIAVTRDLHSWLMHFSYSFQNRREEDDEVEYWLIFELKNFHPKEGDVSRYRSHYYPGVEGVAWVEGDEDGDGDVDEDDELYPELPSLSEPITAETEWQENMRKRK